MATATAPSYRLITTPDAFVIHSASGGDSLVLSRRIGANGEFAVTLTPRSTFVVAVSAAHIKPSKKTYDSLAYSDSRDIDAVFGIFQLLAGPYLAIVTKSKLEGITVTGGQLYRVSKVELLPFVNLTTQSREVQGDDRVYVRKLLQVFRHEAFFFGINFDITHTAQRFATLRPEQRALQPWQRADERFFWNRHLLTPLMDNDCHEWITPMIHGFVEVVRSVVLGDVEFDLFFISRRSCRRQGTRYNSRGVDENGDVSNFAETEQLLMQIDRSIYSFVQIRGSIPLYWQQIPDLRYTPKARFYKSADQSQLAFERHARAIMDSYGACTSINLVDNKGDQRMLSNNFQEAVNRLKNDKFQLEWFDFHHECRKMQWHNLSKLVHRIDTRFQDYGYFHCNSQGQIMKVQTGVFRTNCLDNLDRTNVVQSLLARRAILTMFGKAGNATDVLNSPYESFETQFKHIWADHADVLSELYAGTGALKTDFTRTGKRTLGGALQDGYRSLKRYFVNNFDDAHTQDSVDLFLGKYRPDPADRMPLKKARASETTASFLRKIVLFMMAITAIVCVLSPADMSWKASAGIGVLCATGIVGFLSFLQLKKGVGVGKRVAVKPHFVPLTGTGKGT